MTDFEAKHCARWIAGLNNGETCVEGIGKFPFVKGKDSPAQVFLRYLQENKELKITSLSIQKNGYVYNLPSQSPRFGGELPKGYRVERLIQATQSISGGVTEESIYLVAIAMYEDFEVHLIVDDSLRGTGSWVKIERLGAKATIMK